MTVIHRFVEPLRSPAELISVLNGAAKPSEPLPSGVDDANLVATLSSVPTTVSKDDLDAFLVEPFHKALSGISRREALDMRVWHHLAVQHPTLTWRRWAAAAPTTPTEVETLVGGSREMPRHFMGGPNLSGVSRNSLARLYWVGEILREDDDFALARKAFSSAQLIQSLFERRLGLRPALARAFTAEMHDQGDAAIKSTSLALLRMASTLTFEALDEEELRAVVAAV